ncbi:hypothetical protein Taro_016784, partial [Colocasia esculenta]|nr:hypothetical protein [Colocasia esculenta]
MRSNLPSSHRRIEGGSSSNLLLRLRPLRRTLVEQMTAEPSAEASQSEAAADAPAACAGSALPPPQGLQARHGDPKPSWFTPK